MDARQIRADFLNFFEGKGHKIVPSAPIVVKNDPTLMFTNAGMNQFKDYFLGNKTAEFKRVTDTQKCLRVSGKHNDLEEVGLDTYHHTMFEMLGNWSFGDYFKNEAILWAWELLTEVYKLPEDRLYVTIFEGDKADKLEKDSESYDIWKSVTAEDRILNGNKKDNFWEMGDVGPCGPCSEIHIDLRSDAERKKTDGATLVNMDHPLVVEVWNLVFIQFNRKSDRSLENLPEQHVDTGMGFERLCMAIQAKESNYDTDVFAPLINAIAKAGHVTYGKDEKTDIAIRVVADHVRAVSFAIADGQLPSNNGAGYVIRRILRRAIRYGYSYLNLNEAFIYKLVTILGEQFNDVFPELGQQLDFVSKVIMEEENSFLRTLENGITRFEAYKAKGNVVDGDFTFELYDTFGFPIDLTDLMAREKGWTVDMDGFQKALGVQKDRSRKDSEMETEDWEVLTKGDETFIGYDNLEADVKITRYRKVKAKGKEQYQMVFDQTPFYAESGGQVGDTGYIEAGGEKLSIKDTKKENDLIIHFADKLPKDPKASFKAVVGGRKRKLTNNNHSATHLMHAALKSVLGEHVQQKGSLVNADYLRFDFSHFSKMEESELAEVERLVNEKIRAAIALDEKRSIPIAEAKKMGATALFGEKYGDAVRVITFDPSYSMEFCGGTHVQNTAEIGFFKITSEASISAGVRRIEAITSEKAEEYINKELQVLAVLRESLKQPKDVVKAVQTLLDDNSAMKKKVEKLESAQAGDLKGDLMAKAKEMNGLSIIAEKITLPSANALKQLAFDLKKEVNNLLFVAAADIDGKPQVMVMLSEEALQKGYNANIMIKELSKEIKGGGGGQDFFATAGGKDLNGLDNVVSKVEGLIKNLA